MNNINNPFTQNFVIEIEFQSDIENDNETKEISKENVTEIVDLSSDAELESNGEANIIINVESQLVSTDAENIALNEDIELNEIAENSPIDDEKSKFSDEIYELNCEFNEKEKQETTAIIDVDCNDKKEKHETTAIIDVDCDDYTGNDRRKLLETNAVVIDSSSSSEDEEVFTVTDEEVDETKCNSCSLTFKNGEEWFEHMKTIHGNLAQKKSLKRGLIEEQHEKYGPENSCKQLVESLKDPETSENTPETFYECTVCTKLFPAIEKDLKEVMICKQCQLENSVAGDKKFRCTLCDRDLNYTSWRKHMATVHAHGDFVCKFCQANFTSKQYLTKHIKCKHKERYKSKKPKTQCPECLKGFKNENSLDFHIKHCHSNILIDNDIRVTLKSSRKVLHDYSTKIYECSICSCKFRMPWQISIHVVNCHKDVLDTDLKGICMFCGISFHRNGLANHVKWCMRKTGKTIKVPIIMRKD